MYQYEYPRPALTVDIVLFAMYQQQLQVLLIKRADAPFVGKWALPGGFVDMDETIDKAARRELEEETGLTKVFLEQLYTFGAVNRDPRDRVVSVAHFALINRDNHQIKSGSDASDAKWFDFDKIPKKLAFDHKQILKVAIERMRGKIRYQPIGFELLPKKFTLSQLQSFYETVLDRELDKRNFRKKILRMGLLDPLEEREKSASGRPAQLYKFNRKKYNQLQRQGFHFEI